MSRANAVETTTNETVSKKERKEINEWLKTASTLANVDNITTALAKFGEKLGKSGSNTFMGIAEIVCSVLALLCLLRAFLKSSNKSKLPELWMVLVTVSCVLSIIGSGLVLSDTEESGGRYLAGSFLIGGSKIFHPLLTTAKESDGPMKEEKEQTATEMVKPTLD